MKISTKGRYGVRAMIDLAESSKKGKPVFLSDVAKRQGVSEKYLEHIFSMLNKAGLIKAHRGCKGGYVISRDAKTITLYEIITALEGPSNLVECVDDLKACPRTGTCAARDIWIMLGNKVEEFLKGHTLASLVQMQNEKNQKSSLMYYI